MHRFEYWTVAYRPRHNQETLLDNVRTPFSVINNTWRYWAADPHIIEYKGKTYLFAELYDRVLRRGVIGFCEISDSGVTPWRVALRMPYHLSYPHIVRRGDDFYMIPESYVANEVSVFHAKRFPDEWEKIDTLKANFCAVDSTVITNHGSTYLLTLQFLEDSERLLLFPLTDDGLSEQGVLAAENDCNVRPAGHSFFWQETLVRPGQDCSSSYGCALNFYEITVISSAEYREKLIRKILPAEIHSDLKKQPEGIHTYNLSDTYEVIDLKGYETDWLFYLMRPVWWLWRQLKRVFGKN